MVAGSRQVSGAFAKGYPAVTQRYRPFPLLAVLVAKGFFRYDLFGGSGRIGTAIIYTAIVVSGFVPYSLRLTELR